MTKIKTAADMRKALHDDEQSKSKQYSYGDGAGYPFWSIPENSSATFRFLPDGDDSNPYFWRERHVLRLPFSGSINYPDRPYYHDVVCLTQFGEKDPILKWVSEQGWWKDEEKKPLAKKYYRKISYLVQGFVVSSELVEEEVPENPIRRFTLGPQVFEHVRKILMDPDCEDLVIDYDNGRDFRLAKEKKAGAEFANYNGSSWAMKTRSLSQGERATLAQFGLFKLVDFIKARPTEEQVQAHVEMFHDSLKGEIFDPEKYGLSPRTVDDEQKPPVEPVATTKTTTTKNPPTVTSAPPIRTAAQILEDIKNRTNAKNAAVTAEQSN